MGDGGLCSLTLKVKNLDTPSCFFFFNLNLYEQLTILQINTESIKIYVIIQQRKVCSLTLNIVFYERFAIWKNLSPTPV